MATLGSARGARRTAGSASARSATTEEGAARGGVGAVEAGGREQKAREGWPRRAAGHDVYRLEAKRRFQELLMLVGSMEPENERWLGSRPEQIDGKQIGRRGLLGGSFGIQP
jgi:hypothetical protein